MVARHNGIVEARSSTLLCSTIKIHRHPAVFFVFRSLRVELIAVVNEAPVALQSRGLSELQRVFDSPMFHINSIYF